MEKTSYTGEYKHLLKLGFPIIVAQVGFTLQGMADTLMLGQYSAQDLAAAGFTLINCAWKPLYIVTPDTHWTPDEIMGWYPHNWQHWWDKSVAYPDGYTIDESYPVLGGQLCAWGDRLAGYTDIIKGCDEELALIAERLPALCKRCWEKN